MKIEIAYVQFQFVDSMNQNSSIHSKTWTIVLLQTRLGCMRIVYTYGKYLFDVILGPHCFLKYV